MTEVQNPRKRYPRGIQKWVVDFVDDDERLGKALMKLMKKENI